MWPTSPLPPDEKPTAHESCVTCPARPKQKLDLGSSHGRESNAEGHAFISNASVPRFHFKTGLEDPNVSAMFLPGATNIVAKESEGRGQEYYGPATILPACWRQGELALVQTT